MSSVWCIAHHNNDQLWISLSGRLVNPSAVYWLWGLIVRMVHISSKSLLLSFKNSTLLRGLSYASFSINNINKNYILIWEFLQANSALLQSSQTFCLQGYNLQVICILETILDRWRTCYNYKTASSSPKDTWWLLITILSPLLLLMSIVRSNSTAR